MEDNPLSPSVVPEMHIPSDALATLTNVIANMLLSSQKPAVIAIIMSSLQPEAFYFGWYSVLHRRQVKGPVSQLNPI